VKSGELVDDDFGHGPFSSILFWGVILFLLLCWRVNDFTYFHLD